MKSVTRSFLSMAPFLLSSGAILLTVSAGCDRQADAHSLAERKAGKIRSVSDQPLADFQVELLDVAFEAVSAMPLNPHVKNRSRAQELVVEACLQLDQPQRALGYIEKIDNWRRGCGYADLALYCAQHGGTVDVQGLLDLAREISETAEGGAADSEGDEDQTGQGWRRDRIKAKIANAHLSLGQSQEAAEFAAGLSDSESSKVSAMQAKFLEADTFDEQIAALDGIVETGTFEQVQGALQTSAQIFNRFYDDEQRRSQVEERIESFWKKVPLMVQIELTMELAGFALDHEDHGRALEFVNQAQVVLEGSEWTPEYEISLLARLAGLRHRAGDNEGARSQADAALAMFDVKREQISNFDRADTLRPVAEAYRSMGDSAAALAVYKRAIVDGAENPNARPRADDLSATCCSMALHGVQPDAELKAQILQIHNGLGPPW